MLILEIILKAFRFHLSSFFESAHFYFVISLEVIYFVKKIIFMLRDSLDLAIFVSMFDFKIFPTLEVKFCSLIYHHFLINNLAILP